MKKPITLSKNDLKVLSEFKDFLDKQKEKYKYRQIVKQAFNKRK
tara:strand:- start:1150 stop:1281 length:132 start_codon:yes stop_codon:yes gene_type:complete